MIKSVIFDIDGVLLDSFEANAKFNSDLVTKFGYNPPTQEQILDLFHRSMKDVIKILTRANDEEVERIWRAGKEGEVPYHYELLTTPEGLKETIKILSRDYVLGIVTSRITESVYSISQLAELEQYFKVVVAFQDTENHKPHPEPLLLASKKLGILPEECVYIGDVENDAIAARSAGMKCIVYSKNKVDHADANITSFQNLIEIIKSL